MRISDWSSDVCSSDLPLPQPLAAAAEARFGCEVREVFGSTETCIIARRRTALEDAWTPLPGVRVTPQPDGTLVHAGHLPQPVALADLVELVDNGRDRSEEHTSELQSLMRISYAVFCLKKKK